MTYMYSNDWIEIEYCTDLDHISFEILIDLIVLYLDTTLKQR